MNPDLDPQFQNATLWRDEAIALRNILAHCDVSEAMKWGKPCYINNGNNIAIMQRFKHALALMFFKGAALKDLDKLLHEQGPNSRFARRMEFSNVDEVKSREHFVVAYVEEAIALADAGVKIETNNELELVAELKEALAGDPELSAAFDALTPGRQRGYNVHIGAAKHSSTRLARIEKARDRIFAGKGFNER